MINTIQITRLTAGTTFRVVATGLILSFLPLSIVAGVLSYFGKTTIDWYGRPLTGLSGLVAAPVVGVVSALGCTALLGGAIHLGLWLYSKAKPLEVTFIVDSGEEAARTAASGKLGLLKRHTSASPGS